jgi:hypothetical protein
MLKYDIKLTKFEPANTRIRNKGNTGKGVHESEMVGNTGPLITLNN